MVVGAVVDDLVQVLVGLRSQDLSDVHVDELAAEVVELRRLVDGLEVEWTRRIAHLEKSDVVSLDGHPSMTAFLKDRCRMSGARAQRSVTLSHQLPVLPFVAKALEADDLSFDQVHLGRRRTNRPLQPHTPLPIPPHPRTPNRPTTTATRGRT